MALLPKNLRNNCYFRCEEAGVLHRFPKPDRNVERLNTWKEVLDHNDKKNTNQYIYNQFRLCNKHFEHYFVLPSKRLTLNAVPTLFIRKDNNNNNSNEVVIRTQFDCVSDSVVNNSNKISKQKMKRVPLKNVVKKCNEQIVIKKLNQKVFKLLQKCKTQTKKIKIAKKISEAKPFLKIIDDMPIPLKIFMNMQLKSKQKPKGRKFTLEEKIMAASILKQSQKGYNFLKKIVVLPSTRTIKRLLSVVNIKSGLNKKIFNLLKQNVEHLPFEKRLYTLLFDEISLSPGLYFHKNEIVGFADSGDEKKNIANHGLVLMIKGVKSKSKQPILFTFCKNTTKKYELKKILLDTIRQLREAGIIVISTICDQAMTNTSTIKLLQNETKEKYLREGKEYQSHAFEVDRMKIFPLFDTPHLLKGLRNNFMTKEIRYTQNNKIKFAKWEHLKMLLNEDRGEDEIRILNKLTIYHVDPDKIPKMKVKYATQVFSQRVSAVMRFLASRRILPKECEETADLLIIIDKLFDSFNGHSYKNAKKVLKSCLKNSSPHFQFWDEVVPILKSIEFKKVIKNRDGTETFKYSKVPSVQNWINNIYTFKEMWYYINKQYKIKNILTRNFNQDPLENFFCCIRSNGIRNVNPTCMQFMSAYKTLLINNINSPHSISANCEKDDNQLLHSMKSLLLDNSNYLEPCNYTCEIDYLILTMNDIISSDSILHEEAKKYVAGYVIRKCKTRIFKNCIDCTNDLLITEVDPDSFNYMIDYTKKSLFNACNDFVKLLNEIYFMIVTCLRDSPHIPNLTDKIIFFINCRCDFSILTCKKHKCILIDYLIKLSMNLVVNSWCKGINRILVGKVDKFDKNDKVKLEAFNYYNSHIKKKFQLYR